MRIPAIRGIIDRRILANYRVDPEVMAACLPAPFRPQLHRGFAIGGICLIRLKRVRPRFSPFPWGISSENAAHRVAVEWDENGETRCGVYIPRRDTSSRLNSWAGGRVFPGIHHRSTFEVREDGNRYFVAMNSSDGEQVLVSGTVSKSLTADSVFDSVDAASKFFELGSLGYSATEVEGEYDGLELKCNNWFVQSLEVDRVQSSFFENRSRFPAGSVVYDCALLMRDIDHEWHGRPSLFCSSGDC